MTQEYIVKVVHVIAHNEQGPSIFATCSDLENLIFCYNNITAKDGNFDTDISILSSSPDVQPTQEVLDAAESRIDDVFAEVVKIVYKSVENDDDVN